MKILKKDSPQRYSLGVVYAPGVTDTQNDYASSAEIEKACWGFNRQERQAGSLAKKLVKALTCGMTTEIPWEDIEKATGRGLGLMHELWSPDLGEIVESYIAPCDLTIGDQLVVKGSWLLGALWSPEIWPLVESGELDGYSLGGTATRVPDGA